MNVLHFGAGNIGRGFVYPELKNSKQITNFTFVDVNKDLINKLINEKEYELIYLKQNNQKILKLTDYNAIELDNLLEKQNISLLEQVDIITTSLGQQNLIHLVPIFEELKKIIKKPVIVMCCENGYRISSYFQKILNFKDSNVIFVDCLVDRIIPNNDIKNQLCLQVENYYSWICDQNQWPDKIEKLNTLEYSKNIEKDIYKKMCLLNGLHCAIAWHRYSIDKFKNITTVEQALKQSDTKHFISKFINDISKVISKKFNIDFLEIVEYGLNNIKRFESKWMDDKLFRVGRNPIQKLQKDERILSPLLFAIQNNLELDSLILTFKNGLNYHFSQDPEGEKLKELLFSNSLKDILESELKLTKQEIKDIIKIY